MVQKLDSNIRDLDDEQKRRLWEHGLHEDTMFNNRLNFFLVFESVLLSAVGLLYSKLTSIRPELITITSLGIILTILWGYIQARQKRYHDVLRSLAKEALPEYQIALERIGKWPISGLLLLTYGVPILVELIWIVLLIAVIVT